MKKKALLALASLGMLVTVLIYGTIAWYTTISNVTGITMKAANFDFEVNDQGQAHLIDVFQYQNLNAGLAAPGSGGVIPIKVSTTEKSEVGATYAINMDFTRMAPEFRDRLRFYYYKDKDDTNKKYYLTGDTNSDLIGTLAASKKGTDGKIVVEPVTEYIYWEWLYTADVSAILEAPINGINGKWTSHKYLDQMTNDQIFQAVNAWKTYGTSSQQYTDMAARGAFTHLDPANFGTFFAECSTGADMRAEIEKASWFTAHDEFDTALGFGQLNESFTSTNGTTYTKGTLKVKNGNTTEDKVFLAYQQAMMVDLLVAGAQAAPLRTNDTTQTWANLGTTKYLAGDMPTAAAN